MKIVALLLVALGLYAQSVHVAAAANVSGAIKSIASAFEKKHPAVKVHISIGSSGKLFAQIENGAPYDIFLSANIRYPETLYKKGLIKNRPIVYAKGALALFSTKSLELSKGLALLEDSSIKRIAIGNPKTAPYGEAAKEVLENSHLYKHIASKLIYATSISQTLLYALKGVDVAIVAKSSLFDDSMLKYKEHSAWVEIDATLYTPINQAMALMHPNRKAAANFFAYLGSNEAREILQHYGYLLP